MDKRQTIPPDREALDFSLDSGLRESLLDRIKGECFGASAEGELDHGSAAGSLDEGADPRH